MPARLSSAPVAALAAAMLGLASLAAGPALAGNGGGIFDFLFGRKEEGPPASAPPPATAAPPVVRSTPRAPRVSMPALPTERTYCVRTCDGYYFAIGFTRNGSDRGSDEAMCAASCTGAEMKLYSSPVVRSGNARTEIAIDRAVDETGTPYTELPTANAFQNGGVSTPSCTCQGSANGLPRIPLSLDPTLRDGDIVVMPDGLKVFHGAKTAPHAEDEFVGIADAGSLPGPVRQQMLSLQNRIAK